MPAAFHKWTEAACPTDTAEAGGRGQLGPEGCIQSQERCW